MTSHFPSILLVDDTPDNLRLLTNILQPIGYRIRSALSGSRALESALLNPPDLILLDIMMPEMDGFLTCARLKLEPTLRGIPVIFVTALNDTTDKVKAFDVGAVDYVTKPYQANEVLARVRVHLEILQQRREIAANYQRLQELEQLRENLTQMIVHDMRNPLAVVDGYLQLLELCESANLSPDAQDYLLRARSVLHRLTGLTSDLMVVSKSEARQLEPDLRPVDLVALLHEVVVHLQQSPGDIKIQITNCPAQITLLLDHGIIHRVLQNLLDNALKFSPPNGIIQLSLLVGTDHVRIAVRDSGPGIAPEFRQKIFDKFVQIKGDRGRRGTGLGLTFCQLAVEAHGGAIGVESSREPGSTFWFTLPIRPTAALPLAAVTDLRL